MELDQQHQQPERDRPSKKARRNDTRRTMTLARRLPRPSGDVVFEVRDSRYVRHIEVRGRAIKSETERFTCLRCRSVTCEHVQFVKAEAQKPDYSIPGWMLEGDRELDDFVKRIQAEP